jgi:hypothetical protein
MLNQGHLRLIVVEPIRRRPRIANIGATSELGKKARFPPSTRGFEPLHFAISKPLALSTLI